MTRKGKLLHAFMHALLVFKHLNLIKIAHGGWYVAMESAPENLSGLLASVNSELAYKVSTFPSIILVRV